MWGGYEKKLIMNLHHIGGQPLYSSRYQLFWMFSAQLFSFITSPTEESPPIFWKIMCSKNGGAERRKLLSPIFYTLHQFYKWKTWITIIGKIPMKCADILANWEGTGRKIKRNSWPWFHTCFNASFLCCSVYVI